MFIQPRTSLLGMKLNHLEKVYLNLSLVQIFVSITSWLYYVKFGNLYGEMVNSN